MHAEVTGRLESLVTDAAAPRNLVRVQRQHVAVQRLLGAEALLTVRARERALFGVHERVAAQVARATERHRTAGAAVRPAACVHAHVQVDADRVLEAATTHVAHVSHLVRVRALVKQSRAVLREALVAAGHATFQRPLAGMSQHVRVQSRPLLEHASALVARVLCRRALLPLFRLRTLPVRRRRRQHATARYSVPLQRRHVLKRSFTDGTTDCAVPFAVLDVVVQLCKPTTTFQASENTITTATIFRYR